MSHMTKVVTDQLQRLKRRANYSLVVASLFGGGLAGSIVWAVNGLEPVATVAGIAISVVGTALFGVRVPQDYRRAAWLKELSELKAEVAVTLNMFPEQSEHELSIMAVKQKSAWARLENRVAGGAAFSEDQILRIYMIYKLVHGKASVRYVEACRLIEEVRSRRDFNRLQKEFEAIDAMSKRVQEYYREVLYLYAYGAKVDFSREKLQERLENLLLPFREHAGQSRRVINELRRRELIPQERYTYLLDRMVMLEATLKSMLVSPAKRKDASFEYGLVNLELDAYASEGVLESIGLYHLQLN